MRRSIGFTLIELLIVVSIVAILGLIGTAIYSSQVLKGRRADAINSLLVISLAEERYRSKNSTYGTLAQVGQSSTSPQGYYTLATSNIAATTYTITATAVGSQANDKDGSTSCSTITFSMSAGTITKTPAECWPT